MKALVLAAGFGKRLKPITDTRPKAMVEVNGIPLLANALNNLTAIGIEEIGIVVGHMADYIKDHIGNTWNGASITYYENADYEKTNNIYSLYTAMSFCDQDMLLLECDLFYRADILEELLASKGDCSILVSPFNSDTMDGTVICMNDRQEAELILGSWQGKDFDYSCAKKTVNIYKFSKDFIRKYMNLIKWYVENMGVNSYYEKVLGSLMYLRESDVRIVEVPKETWCEIDDIGDLDRARKIFGDN